ncbi:MAG TPA: hypothetical protein VME43_07820 [Bryobacteraceae bacterium]|nr:hypothetical protein [Bryobacteraceae bacterium]
MFLLELLLACALAAMAVLWRPWLEPAADRLAQRTLWSMLLLAALPVALRLLLLPNHPAPTPDIYDEFGHLLVADTLRHWRLANPPLALSQFFETFFVLQRPTYSSIYPLGQGLILAIGWSLFGHPWAGVLLATAAFCALCYWMLRAWTTPGWALGGGFLAVFEFGPLSQWMNSYWGGAFAAAAGCLVFGALPRLRANGRLRDAALLGAGIGLHLLIRPYESIFLVLAVALYFAPLAWRAKEARDRKVARRLMRLCAVAALAVLPAVVLTLAQDKAVTGRWTTLPEALSMYQYGVPSALTFEPNPVPHRELTPQQAMDYKMQLSFHGPTTDTPATYFERLEYRIRFYRFFFLPPLYLALVVYVATVREYRFAWVLGTLALFALGVNFFPAFQVHYLAACTCLFVLVSVVGLERLSRVTVRGQAAGAEAAGILVLLCVVHFGLWYGVHLFENSAVSRALRPYETWDAINHGNPERRVFVKEALDQMPGRLLVFVRYAPQHIFQDEWVYNGADIDRQRVIWARDLGAQEDLKLIASYPGRTLLLLEPDARTPQLSAYEPELQP